MSEPQWFKSAVEKSWTVCFEGVAAGDDILATTHALVRFVRLCREEMGQGEASRSEGAGLAPSPEKENPS